MKFAIAINCIGTIAKGVIAIGNHRRRLIASEHKTKFGWWARKGILYVKQAFTIMLRAEVVLYIKGDVTDT